MNIASEAGILEPGIAAGRWIPFPSVQRIQRYLRRHYVCGDIHPGEGPEILNTGIPGGCRSMFYHSNNHIRLARQMKVAKKRQG